MNKPISVVRAEFIDDFRSLINNSKLPAFMLEPILDKALRDVRVLMQEQYESDLRAYQESEKNDRETVQEEVIEN